MSRAVSLTLIGGFHSSFFGKFSGALSFLTLRYVGVRRMIRGIGGIEPVHAVDGVDAALMGLTGAPSFRRGTSQRERRLRWLASVREALGKAAPLVDEMAAEEGNREAVAEARAWIAEARDTIEAMRRVIGDGSTMTQDVSAPPGRTITAEVLARHITRSADQSLRVQAKLGPAIVRRLVGEER